MIESHEITIVRTSPDADFGMNRLINQIYTHIESIKKANQNTN